MVTADYWCLRAAVGQQISSLRVVGQHYYPNFVGRLGQSVPMIDRLAA